MAVSDKNSGPRAVIIIVVATIEAPGALLISCKIGFTDGNFWYIQ
jgi:hypothetical protein